MVEIVMERLSDGQSFSISTGKIPYGESPDVYKPLQTNMEGYTGVIFTADAPVTMYATTLSIRGLSPSQFDQYKNFIVNILNFSYEYFSLSINNINFLPNEVLPDLGLGRGVSVGKCKLTVTSLKSLYTRRAPGLYDINIPIKYRGADQ